MIAIAPWGLLGLLALPAILAIHFFRRRFRPRPVTGLFLYGAAVTTVAAGRRRQKLIWRASLWLELAAALALTWWFCDPHWSDRERARHLVLVLDSRLRVAAHTAAGPGVDALLRAELDNRIAALDRDDRVTAVASGDTPTLIIGPAARPVTARTALAAWRPDRPWHDLTPALLLARSLAGPEAELTVVSDREPESLPASVGVLARGQVRPTTGFADVRWLNDAEGERLVLRPLAQGAAARSEVLVQSTAGEQVQRMTVDLPADAGTAFVVPLPRGTAGPLTVTLGTGQDPLPDDNRFTLIRPERAALNVRVALPDPLAAAVKLALTALPDVKTDGTGAPHLLIDDAATQPPLGCWQLRIIAGSAKPSVGPFLARRGHPLLTDLDFTGALWTGGATAVERAALPLTATPLLEAGEAVLLSESRRGRDRLLTMHADLAKATLTRHSAWPALIANLVAARRAALPGPRTVNLPLGQPSLVTLPPGASALMLEEPDGGRTRLAGDPDGEVMLPALRKPGLHQLLLDGPQGVGAWRTVNALLIDPRLGDLRGAATITREAAPTDRASVERSRSTLAHLLPIVLAAVCALAGWWCFRREEGLAS